MSASWEDARPVTIRLDDAFTAATALERWADECTPPDDTRLRQIITRLRQAIRDGIE